MVHVETNEHQTKEKNLGNLLVIKEFWDVFLEEILGIPPCRDIYVPLIWYHVQHQYLELLIEQVHQSYWGWKCSYKNYWTKPILGLVYHYGGAYYYK